MIGTRTTNPSIAVISVSFWYPFHFMLKGYSTILLISLNFQIIGSAKSNAAWDFVKNTNSLVGSSAQF